MNISRKVSQINEIPDVPPERVGTITQDYIRSGAEVSTMPQSDGRVKIVAKFYEDSRYPASGSMVVKK
jgi:hypothetical protein